MRGLEAADLLGEEAREAIAAAVRAADGNEVFFLGRADAEGARVVAVEDYCRGNAHMVPVLRRAARGFDVAIHNHPSGDLTPSDPDLFVAAELGDMGLGFFIVDNAAERVNPVVKLLRREAAAPPVDEARVAAALGEGGPIARLLGERFEARPEQDRMARLVAGALSGGHVAAVEAGTGTGKSLAYLVPALLRAVAAKERVVVSTNTINLQEQLIGKDIPLVIEAWRGIAGEGGEPPRAVLMKGRSNYACLRKVEDLGAFPDGAFDGPEEREEVAKLVGWARRTKEGTREELPAPPTPGAWEKVEVDPDTCTRTACRFYAECFYFKARRDAGAADLIVVNHHLLLSDLQVRRSTGFKSAAVLPPYRHLILDEAHHLEDVASDHFGEQITNAGLKRLLGRLQRARRASVGLLPALHERLYALAAKCAADEAGAAIESALRAIEIDIAMTRAGVDAHVDAAFDAASAFVEAAGGKSGEDSGPQPPGGGGAAGPSLTLRLLPAHRARPEWRRFADDGCALASALRLLAASVGTAIVRPLEGLEGEPRAAIDGLLLEIKAVAGRIDAGANALRTFLDPEPPPGEVQWIERRRSRFRDPTIALRTAPIDVAETLATDVYPNVGAVVLTSATLAVGGGFDYLARRVGLDRVEPPRLRTLKLASPFDYERQCVLAIPHDLPDPQAREFDDAAAAALLGAADAAGGRAFFLFTSYRALDRAWRALEGPLRARGFTALRQGDATRRILIERFRAEAPAVLFATDSFWEGVDVGGGALKLVAIGRLPFKVPSEPLQEARAEAIAAGGGDAFRELTLPQAVLKLKQGFGRLIRSRSDRGAILILDRRVLTKSYGRLFLESLPPARVVRGPLARALEAIAEACR